jgi:16S rRNA (guanine527-N7)-methyltransferase
MKEKPKNESGLLICGLEKLDIIPENRIVSLLNKYVEEIELFNPAYGLVKVKDRNELIIKHVLDSLAPCRILQNFFV